MSQNEINAIKAIFPDFTRSIGEAMWCIFTGNHPHGAYRNIYLPSGQLCQHTWQMWGKIIADARGNKKENYSTYWESKVPDAKCKPVEKKFRKAGWKFEEFPVHLDTDEKFRDETVAIMSENEKILKSRVDNRMSINTVESIKPKKRGRPSGKIPVKVKKS